MTQYNNIQSDIRVNTTSESSTLPVSVNDFKNFIKLPESDAEEDALIIALIKAAWRHVESVTGQILMQETRTISLDFFPTKYFVLPGTPVSSITSITYLDGDDVSQTYSSSNYTLDANRPLPRVYIKKDSSIPSSLSDEPNNATVTYVGGYASADAIPTSLTQAVKVLAAHWYDNRDLQKLDVRVTKSNYMLDLLLGPYTLPKL